MTATNYYYIDGLESKRLTTQFLKKEDWEDWTEFYNEKDSGRFSEDFDREKREMKAKIWIDHQVARYQDRTYGLQWVVDKKSNEKIGQCGLLLQNIEGVMELEVGYNIFQKYRGMGYASEAAQIFRDFGFKSQPVHSIVSLIDPKNYASQRVAESMGMTRGAFRKWKGIKYYFYRITRHEWEGV